MASQSNAQSKSQLKTQLYAWEGFNKRKEKMKGEMACASAALVKANLRRQGIDAIKVKKMGKSKLSPKPQKIKSADISIFARQMATMMQAGIPLVQSFDIVARGLQNPSMQRLVLTIKADVEGGHTLAESLAKHPQFFNPLFCNLVNAGEQAGALETMLDRVATYQEKTESIKKKIKKAMMYPTAVIGIAFLVTAALLVFVVPQFESLFKGFGADLPAPTQFVVGASKFFQSYWWVMAGIIVGTGMVFKYFKQRSKVFNYALDRIMLRLPVVGMILYKAIIARFTRTLSITFAAGLPLVDALDAVSGATGNLVFSDATMRIKDQVSSGQQLQSAMRSVDLFPAMVIQMTAIGEESGSLEKMLGKVASFFEEEVDNLVDSLSSLLEPIILVFLAVIVGGLVVAMYMPIFKLGSVV